MMSQVFVWTFSDVFAIAVAVALVLAVAVAGAIQWVRQAMCKHDDGVNETSACHAICRKCGKNLGFIGAWRGKR